MAGQQRTGWLAQEVAICYLDEMSIPGWNKDDDDWVDALPRWAEIGMAAFFGAFIAQFVAQFAPDAAQPHVYACGAVIGAAVGIWSTKP